MTSLRVVLALSAIEDLDLRALNIFYAYISGTLEEEVYISLWQSWRCFASQEVPVWRL